MSAEQEERLLEVVRAARAADDVANNAAARTRDQLKAAAQAALAQGVPVVHIARAAGISRQNLYAWQKERSDQ